MSSRAPTPQAASRTTKSPDAFWTISEVAAELDVKMHVLRFWETRFRRIKPVRRNGRRYYRPKAVDLMRQIRWLHYDKGLTIRGVQRLLDAVEGQTPPSYEMRLLSRGATGIKQEARAAILAPTRRLVPVDLPSVNRRPENGLAPRPPRHATALPPRA